MCTLEFLGCCVMPRRPRSPLGSGPLSPESGFGYGRVWGPGLNASLWVWVLGVLGSEHLTKTLKTLKTTISTQIFTRHSTKLERLGEVTNISRKICADIICKTTKIFLIILKNIVIQMLVDYYCHVSLLNRDKRLK